MCYSTYRIKSQIEQLPERTIISPIKQTVEDYVRCQISAGEIYTEKITPHGLGNIYK